MRNIIIVCVIVAVLALGFFLYKEWEVKTVPASNTPGNNTNSSGGLNFGKLSFTKSSLGTKLGNFNISNFFKGLGPGSNTHSAPATAVQLFASLSLAEQYILNTPVTSVTNEASVVSKGSVAVSKVMNDFPGTNIAGSVAAINAYLSQLDKEKNAALTSASYETSYFDTCSVKNGEITLAFVINIKPQYAKQAVMLAQLAAEHSKSLSSPNGLHQQGPSSYNQYTS